MNLLALVIEDFGTVFLWVLRDNKDREYGMAEIG
jgi:hypothetical protein